MVNVLIIFGVITIIISFIFGVFSGSFLVFLFSILSGGASAVIFFALAVLISNQERQIQISDEQLAFFKQQFPTLAIRCPKCQYQYDSNITTCPRCGTKTDKEAVEHYALDLVSKLEISEARKRG